MMGRTTFIFKTEKSFLRVLKALNDTMYVFCTFKDKEITVFGEPAAQSVGEALDECGIRYDLKK